MQIAATVCNGRFSYLSGDVGARFFSKQQASGWMRYACRVEQTRRTRVTIVERTKRERKNRCLR